MKSRTSRKLVILLRFLIRDFDLEFFFETITSFDAYPGNRAQILE